MSDVVRHPGYDVYDETDEDELARLLVGRRVTRVSGDTLLLDDGTLLELQGNDGCSCGAGDYELTTLNDCDNVITRVEVVARPGGDGYDDYDGVYEIFVYAAHERVNLATFTGSDGNGYYGTGFTVRVTRPQPQPQPQPHPARLATSGDDDGVESPATRVSDLGDGVVVASRGKPGCDEVRILSSDEVAVAQAVAAQVRTDAYEARQEGNVNVIADDVEVTR